MSDKVAQSIDDLEQTALASLDAYQARILDREAQLAASQAEVATLRQALAREWIDVFVQMPANGHTVLVFFVNALGNGRTARAAYFEAGTLELDDDALESDENDMNVEAGWFEDSEAREPAYWLLSEHVTHWTSLPTGPITLAAVPAPAAPLDHDAAVHVGLQQNDSGCGCAVVDGYQRFCKKHQPRPAAPAAPQEPS